MDRTLKVNILSFVLLAGLSLVFSPTAIAQNSSGNYSGASKGSTVAVPLLFDTMKVKVRKNKKASASYATSLLDYHHGDLASLKQTAKGQGKSYIVKFETSWCINCKKLDAETFTNHRLSSYINSNMLAITLDAETNFDGIQLASEYQVNAYPTVLVFGANGSLIRRYEGLFSASYFLSELQSF